MSVLSKRFSKTKIVFFSALILVCLVLIGGVVAVQTYPSIGALGADRLRALVGDQAVAQAEGILFKVQDFTASLEYRSGIKKVSSPWQAGTAITGTANQGENTMEKNIPVTGATAKNSPVTAPAQEQAVPGPSNVRGFPPNPAPSQSANWTLQPIPPLGDLAGEGTWTSYIQDGSGQTIAERTYLQPDPARPYALIGIVAFNLQKIRVHFVIGTEEPYAHAHPVVRSDGKISPADMAPGVLLAAFNGGFKYPQGHFGAMANGLTSAPPLDGLATLVIDANGQPKIGAWGQDISPSVPYQAWRQNGPLAIHDGQVSPQVSNPRYWGFTVNGVAATWRSAVGISQDGNTLYYFAGPYLTITSLTRALTQAGIWNGMQLDINDYWVHFDAFQSASGRLVPEALFPEWKNAADNRFLRSYTRDFFYITAR